MNNIMTERERYETVDMLYSGVSDALKRLAEALHENNVEQSANNLGDALAGVTILMDAVDVEAGGEAGAFLKGLYSAIFVNLSTIMITKDIDAVKRSERYIKELRVLWRERVLAGYSNVETSSAIFGNSDINYREHSSM